MSDQSLTNFNMVRSVSINNMNSSNRLRDDQSDGGMRFSLDDPDFESYLRTLKRHGCAILVTGEASRSVFAAMTRQLLGAPSEPRKRLLALTNTTTSDAGRLLPDGIGVDDSDVQVLEYNSATRTTAVESSSPPPSIPGRSDLVEFQDDICDAIEEVTAGSDDLAPANLRVGVVDLGPLVSAYETETVAEFVRTVGASVVRARGISHYCLPTPVHAPVVADLQPEFDARIEIRKGNGKPPMHRWYVPEYDFTTPWVEI